MAYLLIFLFKFFIILMWIFIMIVSAIQYLLKFLWNLKKPKWSFLGEEDLGDCNHTSIEILLEMLNIVTYKKIK